MGVASILLAVISLALALYCYGAFSLIGIPVGIIGIVLGAIGRKNQEKRKIATIGMGLAIAATVVSLIMFRRGGMTLIAFLET